MKKCRICKTPFEPVRPLQTACSFACARAYGKSCGDKERAKAEQQERREHKAKLAKARMTLPKAKAIAQKAVNAYVRARDYGKPCISCDGPPQANKFGGSVDAGHFRSVGSAPHLRYHLHNVHAQCKRCNNRLSGNHFEYGKRLPARIGQEAYDKLYADQSPRHYSVDDLLRMAKIFNRKAAITERRKGLAHRA